MVIKRESKSKKSSNNKENEEESTYAIIKRERVEKEAKEKQKKLDIENENKRLDKIIIPYLESLDNQLEEKNLFTFWVFADRKSFKKINGMTYHAMQSFIKKDVDKYQNRYLAYFKIYTGHDNPVSKVERNWLSLGIIIYHIDEEGNLANKKYPAWGCDILWKDDDFKISKFSFQFAENLLRIVAARKHTCESLSGVRLEKVLKDLKKKKIDIGDVLNPLAGV